jgi:hypothetical protein
VTLLECFDRYGCDKGSSKHRYDRAYEPVLKHLKDAPIRLLEIGVLRGASLSAWMDYFPNAQVIGVDTFQRVSPKQIEILKHPRVTWWQLDSTEWTPMIDAVDIIIDDGDHIQASQRLTFAGYRHLLKPDGVYFIEDVLPFDAKQPAKLNTRYPENTAEGHRELMSSLAGYRVIPHDLRDARHPVSYLLEIRR